MQLTPGETRVAVRVGRETLMKQIAKDLQKQRREAKQKEKALRQKEEALKQQYEAFKHKEDEYKEKFKQLFRQKEEFKQLKEEQSSNKLELKEEQSSNKLELKDLECHKCVTSGKFPIGVGSIPAYAAHVSTSKRKDNKNLAHSKNRSST
jgi:hypothetical protein